MRLSYLLTVISCALLLLSGCTVQRAPGAYAAAKGSAESGSEKKEQTAKVGEPAPAPVRDVVKPVEEETIVFKGEEPEPVRVEEAVTIEPVAPVGPVKEPVAEEKVVTRAEQFTVVEASGESLLKEYNVVIGSFGRKDNAGRLKQRMASEGYKPVIVINDKGMYRVILASYGAYKDARALISGIKGEFADAWVLVQK